MRRKHTLAAGAVILAATIGFGSLAVGAAQPADDDGGDVPITGEALDTASTVALAHTGEGRVTDTEEGDEESFYEVEVTLDDGSEVDVQLDRDFNVVGTEAETAVDDD